jgi:uncharacterized cysteine cluster protein YcgN (CxxCxxCC family)
MPPQSSQKETLSKAASSSSKARDLASAKTSETKPFWKDRELETFSQAEWESLCDGCGRCCLVKLEDEDTGEIHFTDLGCKLLDGETCQCSDYRRRRQRVRDCLKLTPASVRSLPWLPPTCAYRVLAEGRDLAWWHPLVSGTPDTVHEAGVSVKGRVAALETEIKLEDYPDYIVSWPKKVPKAAKGAKRPNSKR